MSSLKAGKKRVNFRQRLKLYTHITEAIDNKWGADDLCVCLERVFQAGYTSDGEIDIAIGKAKEEQHRVCLAILSDFRALAEPERVPIALAVNQSRQSVKAAMN